MLESKKIEETGQVARTTHMKWIQHAVSYSQDKTHKRLHIRDWKNKVLQKEDLGILTGSVNGNKHIYGGRGGTVVKVLFYKSEGRRSIPAGVTGIFH